MSERQSEWFTTRTGPDEASPSFDILRCQEAIGTRQGLDLRDELGAFLQKHTGTLLQHERTK